MWGNRMKRFREGVPTLDDIDTINNECDVKERFPPEGLQIATYTNRDRDAINTALFDDLCVRSKPTDGSTLEMACVVFMDELHMTDSNKTPAPVQSNAVKKHFYENCSESDCNHRSKGRGRVDPMLKLYVNAPVMLTQNSDVANGEANGSRVFTKSIEIKAGETFFDLLLDNGTTICAIFASQVESITVEHENQDITPRQFEVLPQRFSFTCKMNIGEEDRFISMKGLQFPVISNTCTTGHKLQGCTVDSILANDWFYGANWAYVVLSRVKTMAGLYLRKRLSRDLRKYAKPEEMKRMLQVFADTIQMEMLTDVEYETLEASDYIAPAVPTVENRETEDAF